MNKIVKNKRIIISFIFILLFILITFVFFNNKSGVINKNITDIKNIKVTNNKGDNIMLNKKGQVSYNSDNKIMASDTWEDNKTSAFFSYFFEKYGDNASYEDNILIINLDNLNNLGNNDELFNIVTEELLAGNNDDSSDDGENDDDSGSGGGLSDYFNSPTPNPTPTSTATLYPTPSGSTLPTATPDPDEVVCLYWKLSYCVTPATPTPTPTLPPITEGTLPANCGDNLETGRTIISNELCITE